MERQGRADGVRGEELLLTEGRVWEPEYEPVSSGGDAHGGHLWLFRDVTERRQSEVRRYDYAMVLEVEDTGAGGYQCRACLNVQRAVNHLNGKPLAPTRKSPLARLCA